MNKPCSTCPFREGTTNYGAIDWLQDVMIGIKSGQMTHTCHKTDPAADGYVRGDQVQHCSGYLGMLKKSFGDLPIALKAKLAGDVKLEDIPTRGIFYIRQFIRHHMKPFGLDVGDQIFKGLKG